MNVTAKRVRTRAAALVAAAITLFPTAGCAAAAASPLAVTAGHAGGTTGGTTGTNAPAGPFSDAPTENLFLIASHLSLRHRSVTTVVSVPAGLAITDPVEISILFGTQRITKMYNRAVINKFIFDFDALDGAARRENVTISLRDDTPSGPKTYAVPLTVDLEPLFDVTISPLGFIALGVCDPTSPADPVLAWVDAEGNSHIDVELDGNAGRITTGFAGTWREVGASRGLTLPKPTWYERDLPIDFGAPPEAGPPVLPGRTHHVRTFDDGGDCNGQFDYDVTVTLRRYRAL
jgi:hypothetical protein